MTESDNIDWFNLLKHLLGCAKCKSLLLSPMEDKDFNWILFLSVIDAKGVESPLYYIPSSDMYCSHIRLHIPNVEDTSIFMFPPFWSMENEKKASISKAICKELFAVCNQHDIVFNGNGGFSVFLPKGTTLEQVLVEMDLNT